LPNSSLLPELTTKLFIFINMTASNKHSPEYDSHTLVFQDRFLPFGAPFDRPRLAACRQQFHAECLPLI